MITRKTYWQERTIVKVVALSGWADQPGPGDTMDSVIVRKLKGTQTRRFGMEDLRKLSSLEALASTTIDWPVSPVEPG